MKVVKGEILRFKDGAKIAGFEKFDYCVCVYTGQLDELGVLPSDSYGQTEESEYQMISADLVERTGKLIWEFDHTLFPHIIELLKEYYAFAVYSEELSEAAGGGANDLQI